MKLERFALIAEIVAGFSIAVTLLILIFEVRANTGATEAATRQSIAARTEQIALAVAINPELGGLVWEGLGVTVAEARFRAFFGVQMSHLEEAYLQYRDGRLEEEYFESRLRRGMFILQSEMGQREFARQGALRLYNPEFLEHMKNAFEEWSTERANSDTR